MDCSMPGFPVLHSFPELAQIHVTELMMASNHLILCRPLLLLLSIFPSIRVLFNESSLSGGQSIGASASASVFTMNFQGWFPLGLTGLISLQSKGLSESSPTPQFESINYSALSLLYVPTLINTWETITLIRQTFVGKVMTLPFNMLSRFF